MNCLDFFSFVLDSSSSDFMSDNEISKIVQRARDCKLTICFSLTFDVLIADVNKKKLI